MSCESGYSKCLPVCKSRKGVPYVRHPTNGQCVADPKRSCRSRGNVPYIVDANNICKADPAHFTPEAYQRRKKRNSQRRLARHAKKRRFAGTGESDSDSQLAGHRQGDLFFSAADKAAFRERTGPFRALTGLYGFKHK